MDHDDYKMNDMISKCENVSLKKLPHWYSWESQRKMNYDLATQILLNLEVTPKESIDMAVEFHKAFFDKVLKH